MSDQRFSPHHVWVQRHPSTVRTTELAATSQAFKHRGGIVWPSKRQCESLPESFLNTQSWHRKPHRCLGQWTCCPRGKNISFVFHAFQLTRVGVLAFGCPGLGEHINTLPADTLHTFFQLTTSFSLCATQKLHHPLDHVTLTALTNLLPWVPRALGEAQGLRNQN